MALKLITAPTLEPVTLAEAKLHIRQDSTADDALITTLITVARKTVEAHSLHALVTQTWDLFMDGFPCDRELELPFPPLQSVTGVYYTPDGGVETTYASTNYVVDTSGVPGRIVLTLPAYWPGDVLQVVNGVRVRFVCGFGATAASVDERAVQAIKLLVGHYYENREATQVKNPAEMPLGVSSLLWELRAKVMDF